METFRTALKAQPAPFQISHEDRIMLVGSCFTEHIGERLAAFKLPILTNPFGIVYNPASMIQGLERLAAGRHFFQEQDIFEYAGLWHSWAHHGRFSKPDKDEMLAGINAAYTEAVGFLQQTTRLLLTFGTADVFMLKESSAAPHGKKASARIVANNHKMPAALFSERRLTVPEIVHSTVELLQKLKSSNEALEVVLTVSPVRHLRSGMVANQRSKATLVLACEEICQRLPYAHYFPAYEMLLDDLRDYRFYAADMVHPSEVAIQYIWDFFSNSFFSPQTKILNERIGKISSAAKHRPFHPNTAEYRAFAQSQLAAIEQLRQTWPGLNFEQEIEWFQKNS